MTRLHAVRGGRTAIRRLSAAAHTAARGWLSVPIGHTFILMHAEHARPEELADAFALIFRHLRDEDRRWRVRRR